MTNWQKSAGELYVPAAAADGPYVAIKDGVRFSGFGRLVDGDSTIITVDPVTGDVSVDATFGASIIDAKGDLIVGASDNTPARLAVGSNGNTLAAYSSATNGVKWVTSSVPVVLLPAGSDATDVPANTPVGSIILVKA